MAHGLLTGTEQGYYNGDSFGGYQFISLSDVIDNFTATYIGEGKLLEKTLRSDVSFHAHRALQELSFDTFKSCKSQEIEVPASLTMPLPRDYVNYVKLSWSDSSGIEHIIYPASKTSNPKAIKQNTDGDYAMTAVGTLTNGSDTVVLDAEYTNIWVGLIVSGPNVPNGSTVIATSTTSSITTITISNSSGVTYTGTETLTFSMPDGSLFSNQENSLVLAGLSWTGGDNKITANSTADAGTVTVGMIISHEDFAVGTTAIDVNGSVITTSSNAISTGSSENANFILLGAISDTWSKYKSNTPSENQDDYQDDTYWPMDGQRYGLDPQHAQANGSYFIDCAEGKIHFSSNISGKTVILKYISDSLGTHEEMQVHKFAEEAVYKWIAYGCLSARADVQEYVINRYKKERFAETRKAKLRLSNLKLEEITQIFRGKSKQIKH
tara:strand:- start:3286 stop:4599 length:1314 start_codon:yes stop_codon:yes gene_type:complete